MTQDRTADPAAATSFRDFDPAEGHPRRWAVLGVLVVSLLIVVLDNTVLNIALPTIQRDLEASQSELVWSVDSYILVFAALLFTWGVLGDRYGRKRILLTGLVLFAVGSALSAIAADPLQLIGFRALMGVGGAAVLPVTLAIITVVFPPHERGRAIGMWAGAVGAAVALGPVLGGILLEHPEWSSWLTGNDWGSVFLINVPIVAVGVIGILRVVPETRNPNPGRLDLIGLLLSVSGLTLIVFGIIRASDTNDWFAPSVIWPATAGLAIVAWWLISEARSDHASFDVSLFRNRGFAVSLTAVSLTFFAMSGVMFTLPFFLQTVRGLSTLEAGLCFLPFAVGQLLAAPRSATLVARFGNRMVIGTGLVLVSLSLLGMTQLSPDVPLAPVLGVFFVFGLGMGAVIAPASTVMQNALPIDRVGAGSAVQNTVRQVFGAFGVAVIGTLLDNAYLTRVEDVIAGLPTPLPAQAAEAVRESVAAVPPVTAALTENGAPASIVDALRDGSFASFMDAANLVTWICLGVVVVAAVSVLTLLPHVPQRVPGAVRPPAAEAETPQATAVVAVPDEGLGAAAASRPAVRAEPAEG